MSKSHFILWTPPGGIPFEDVRDFAGARGGKQILRVADFALFFVPPDGGAFNYRVDLNPGARPEQTKHVLAFRVDFPPLGGQQCATGRGYLPHTEGSALARARRAVRLAARSCCRAHGTTCPDCRAADYESPRWVVRLRDLRDALRAWWIHG